MSKANQIRRAVEKLPPIYTHEEHEPADIPVIKLFTPDAAATWWFSEYDPESGQLFGLCDLGLGFPELGYASIDELEALRGALGLPVEIDLYWKGSLADAQQEVRA